MPRTIDTHTHVLADATIKLLQREIPSLGLKMTPFDADNAVCEVAGVAYRPFPRGGNDIGRRFQDMDAAEVDMHVLSVSPQTWLYDQDVAVGVAGAAIQNDACAAMPAAIKTSAAVSAGLSPMPAAAVDSAPTLIWAKP